MISNFQKVRVCENILNLTDDGEIFKLAAELRSRYIHAGWFDQFGVVAALDRASESPDLDVLMQAFEACDRSWFGEVCDGDINTYDAYYEQRADSFYSIDEIEYAASIFGRYLASDEAFLRTLYGLFADLAGVPHPTGTLDVDYAKRNLAWLCEAYASYRPWADDLFRVYAPFDGVVPEGISCPMHSSAYGRWEQRQAPSTWDKVPMYEWEELPVREGMHVAYA